MFSFGMPPLPSFIPVPGPNGEIQMLDLSPPKTSAEAEGFALVSWRIIGTLVAFGASAFLVFAGLRLFLDHWPG